MDVLWTLPVIDGPVPWIVYAVSALLIVTLLARRVTPRWLLTAVLGIGIGAGLALGAYLLINAARAMGTPLAHQVGVWAVATLGAIGLAVVSLWDSRVWRKIVAAFAIVWFALSGMIGVNAFYGLNHTLGSIFGIVSGNAIPLPSPKPSATATGPLYLSWTPPAGMPTAGQVGVQPIAGLVSGFDARSASIYLPPAALVPNAPALPLVIMMMGYPGNPDPTPIVPVLDQLAAQHKGLAPIVIVADQIGNGDDPACADSQAFGNAQTYINTDVVNWARAHLNIIRDPKAWVIAGYSNGGGCAIKYGALHPDVFQNILDISGEVFPGSEDPNTVLARIYGGDQAKFDAAKPISIMASKSGAYRGVTAVFTAGGADPEYIANAHKVSDAAKVAGMTVTNAVIPGASHVGDVVTRSFQEGMNVLYPVLGLSAP